MCSAINVASLIDDGVFFAAQKFFISVNCSFIF